MKFTVLALIPFFTWAIGDFFGTLSSRRIGNIPTNIGFLTLSFVLLSLYVPFAGGIPDWSFFVFAFVLGGIHVIGLLSYFRGLEVGNAALVGAIAGSFSIGIVLLSVLLFHERLNTIQMVGVISCFIGLFFASFPLQNMKQLVQGKISHEPGLVFAFITFVAWSVYFTVVRIPVERIGWFWSLYPTTFYFVPLLLIPGIRKKVLRAEYRSTTLFLLLALTVFGRVGDFAYNLSLTRGLSSLLGAIAGSSPVVFVLLSFIFLRDRLTTQQKIGVFFTLLGIVSIASS